MAITIDFEVEDGTGKSDATSYVTLEEFQQYWINRGVDYTNVATYPENTLKGWLNNATAYADRNNRWGNSSSEKVETDQALKLPIDDWYSIPDGDDISGTIPDSIKNGVCELAAAITTGSTTSRVEGIASKSMGPVSTSFRGGAKSGTKTYPAAEKYFRSVERLKGGGICRF